MARLLLFHHSLSLSRTNEHFFKRLKTSVGVSDPTLTVNIVFVSSWRSLIWVKRSLREWRHKEIRVGKRKFVRHGRPVWPDLAKFRHFGNFLTVYFLFSKWLSLLWRICDNIFGLIFIVANGQILKINLTIWSSPSWQYCKPFFQSGLVDFGLFFGLVQCDQIEWFFWSFSWQSIFKK